MQGQVKECPENGRQCFGQIKSPAFILADLVQRGYNTCIDKGSPGFPCRRETIVSEAGEACAGSFVIQVRRTEEGCQAVQTDPDGCGRQGAIDADIKSGY